MARSINGKLLGKAAVLDLQDLQQAERERREKFSQEWKDTLNALQEKMTFTEFDTFWDSFPAEMTKRDFLPIMKSKLAALELEQERHKALQIVTDVTRPTYDELIHGAKFTDEHRAELQDWWNKKYDNREEAKRLNVLR